MKMNIRKSFGKKPSGSLKKSLAVKTIKKKRTDPKKKSLAVERKKEHTDPIKKSLAVEGKKEHTDPIKKSSGRFKKSLAAKTIKKKHTDPKKKSWAVKRRKKERAVPKEVLKKEEKVRVPRSYKESAKLLKKVQNGGSIESLIYSVRHKHLERIYALACKAIRNNTLLDKVLKESGVMNKKFDVNLAKVLASELLWGKKTLAGDSKPVKLMMSFKSQLETALASSNIPVANETELTTSYARVNTMLTTVEETIKHFELNKWILIDTPVKYDEFLDCVKNLTENDFMKDFHFQDLLVFPSKSKLSSDELVRKGYLILQDKASCVATLLLNPTPGSVVLDMCAAPGVETVHLATLMKNEGMLFAVERSPKKLKSVQELVEKHCGKSNCVRTLLLDPVTMTSENCPDVQYILVAPSFSGTGMMKCIENQNDIQSELIKKCARIQERILIQALTAFPEVKRVVYSTCSVLKEQNEEVIKRVLARVPQFQVVDPGFKKWKRRGDPQYSFGSRCLVTDVDGDLTHGTFMAVLERISSKFGKEMETNSTGGRLQLPESREGRKRKADVGTPKKKIGVAKKKICVAKENMKTSN